MKRIRPGEPGHGGKLACLRLRPARIVDGVAQGGWTDKWEIICPACGDDVDLDYVTVSPFLQRTRGPYRSEAEGLAALRRHRGEAAQAAELVTSPADSEQTEPHVVLRPAIRPAQTMPITVTPATVTPTTVTPATEEPADPRPGVAVAGDSAGGQRF
jgi:hypothetical protein